MMRSICVLGVLSVMVSQISAHMAVWHEAGLYIEKDSVKDRWDGTFKEGYTPVIPLGAGNPIPPPPGGFWFHGADLSVKKKEGTNAKRLKLRAGGTTTVEIACERKYTNLMLQNGVYTNGAKYGTDPNAAACPDGDEIWRSRHVKQYGPEELLGCALAIAYKSPDQINWNLDNLSNNDLIVFSVNQNCIKNRDTTFSIPANMPLCPTGGCICSWFWQGKESNDEMYMTGFLCDVEGGKSNLKPGIPQPAKFCGDGRTACVTGPKQPLIWLVFNFIIIIIWVLYLELTLGLSRANTDPIHPMNVQKVGENKPSYLSSWGFSEGAQPVAGSSGTFTTATTSTTKPTSTGSYYTSNSGATQPVETCQWAGHCKGAPCQTHDDCSDPYYCGTDKTCTGGSSKFRRSVVGRA